MYESYKESFITNEDIEEGTYTAVRWDIKNSKWLVTKVDVRRKSSFRSSYGLIITDLTSNRKPFRQDCRKFTVDREPPRNSWVYSQELTVKELKELIIRSKLRQIKETYDQYTLQCKCLEMMEADL